jgi:L-threonylcarbamoyladenylate synthase
MTVQRIDIRSAGVDRAGARCREVIRAGGIIAFPTDTFYGLGADPRNREAILRLFRIKGRPADQPILILLPDAEAVVAWTARVEPAAARLMERFWPGPLTILFPANAEVLQELTAGSGKIGLRVPGSAVTRSLLRAIGTALTGTSANLSGKQSPRTANEVIDELGDAVDLVVDGGETEARLPSTVVDVCGHEPVIIREGAVERALLR